MLYDKDIREPLFDFLERTYGKNRIFEEKMIGSSRADAVMVLPSAVCGIEIKSDADTYARLEGQVKDYTRYYDYNFVAVGSSHGAHVAEHVPEDWGIITIDETEDGPDFYMLRTPKKNEKRSLALKLGMLWRPELAHIQTILGMHEYKRMSKTFVQEKILQTATEEELDRLISEELFERDYDELMQKINDYRKSMGLRKKKKRRVTKYKKNHP